MTTIAVKGGFAKNQKRAAVALAASGNIVAAVAGGLIKVITYSFQSRNDGMTIQLTDGNGGAALTHVWTFNTREGVIAPLAQPDTYHFAGSAGTALYGVITGAGTVDVDVSYWDDDSSKK
jgi:hypothetical protein